MIDMQQWSDSIKAVQKDERIRLAIGAGFGPGTVNMFRAMLGLPEANWQDRKEKQEKEQHQTHDSNQRTLSDFIN
jgi:hypothetical protein